MISEVRVRKPKSATPGERVVRSDPPARVEKPHVGTLAYRFRDVIGAAPELPTRPGESSEPEPTFAELVARGALPPTDLGRILGTWPGDLGDGFEEMVKELRVSGPSRRSEGTRP